MEKVTIEIYGIGYKLHLSTAEMKARSGSTIEVDSANGKCTEE